MMSSDNPMSPRIVFHHQRQGYVYGFYAYGVATLGAQLGDRPIFLQNHAVETQMLDGVPELRLSIL